MDITKRFARMRLGYHSALVYIGCVLNGWHIMSLSKAEEIYHTHVGKIVKDILPILGGRIDIVITTKGRIYVKEHKS